MGPADCTRQISLHEGHGRTANGLRTKGGHKIVMDGDP
jgi:hypothetical protein